MKYIDAERLKEILKSKIKDRKRWMKDPAKSDRQDQLWSDLNGEDMSIIKIIYILQEEQPEVDLEKEFETYLDEMNMYVSSDDDKVKCYNEDCADSEGYYFRTFKAGFNLGLNARKKE